MTYLTENQIHDMAVYALNNYEICAEKSKLGQWAAEYAADEFGVTATPSQIGYAVTLALTGWEGIKIAVKAAVDAEFK